MIDNLKRISESIDAVRIEMGAEGTRDTAHLDILLCQIAEELRRIERTPGPRHQLQGLAVMIEGKTNA